MDLKAALDIVVGATRHTRYRDLCDPSHPAYDPAYIPLVLELAKDPGPPRPASAPQTTLLAGDIVEVLAKRIGADRLARFIERKLGVPCGCPERQAALNRLDASLRRYLTRGTR